MSRTVDDELKICLDFVLHQLKQRPQTQDITSGDAPFLLGLSGVQGCGKTTLVRVCGFESRFFVSLKPAG